MKRDATGAVDGAAEDGTSDGGIADHVIPAVDRNLAGKDDGSGAVPVLDDFQEVAALFGGEGLRSPIVEEEQVDMSECPQQAGVAADAPGHGQGGEQARHTVTGDRQIFTAGFVAVRLL